MISFLSHVPMPAEFIGVQCGFSEGDVDDSIDLFTLNQPVGEHPVDSTVSRQTLEGAGYYVPPREELVKCMRPRLGRTLAVA